MRLGRLLLVVAALALLFVPASASGARRDCTWGASSVQAQLVNGRVVESTPVTTGCTP